MNGTPKVIETGPILRLLGGKEGLREICFGRDKRKPQ